MNEDNKLKRVFLITSMVLFLASLTQKCYCTTSSCGDSIMVLLLGWAALTSSAAGIAWFANPLLFLSWFLLGRNLKMAMALSVFAALLSLSFLLFDSITDNEGGSAHNIVSYKPGYWLWLCSNVCMLIGTFALMLRYNTRKAAAVPSRWSKR